MITAERITKYYRTQHGRHYVFRDVSFVLLPRKSVGILGRNGSGKTTLMRIIGGIEHPDVGQVVCNKRISWPVGLAGGIHGSLTGRESVKFVSRVHGLDAEEMSRVVEYVRNFAELGDYFDNPVSTYSSGMRSRLNFGMSMAFDFDYYLVDEVTSVGDADFRAKSQTIFEKKRETANLIYVSHNVREHQRLCDVGLVVHNGCVEYYESINAAIQRYQSL